MNDCLDCRYAKEICETNENVKAIKRVLIGDEFKPMGLIQEHEDLKMKVDSINRKVVYYIGAGTGLIVVFGWFLWFLVKIKIL